MIRWFVLNGVATSGKGFFVEQMRKHINVYYISSVDIIKNICKQLGWDGEKNDISREALSEFKKLSIKYFDHPYKYVETELNKFLNSKEYENFLFCVDVREPEEIKKLTSKLGFSTVLVKNSRINHVPDNDSDKNIENFEYDYIIDNNGTEEDLDNAILKFLNYAGV